MCYRRTSRLLAASLSSVAIIGSAAEAASATTIRQGSATTPPTASSAAVPSGSTIGAPLVAARFRGESVNQVCSAGSASGKLGTNPAANVVFTPQAFDISNCNTNTWGALSIISVSLRTPGSGLIASTSIGGSLTVSGAVFRANILSGGLVTQCDFKTVTDSFSWTFANASSSRQSSQYASLRLQGIGANSCTGTLFRNSQLTIEGTAVSQHQQ